MTLKKIFYLTIFPSVVVNEVDLTVGLVQITAVEYSTKARKKTIFAIF